MDNEARDDFVDSELAELERIESEIEKAEMGAAEEPIAENKKVEDDSAPELDAKDEKIGDDPSVDDVIEETAESSDVINDRNDDAETTTEDEANEEDEPDESSETSDEEEKSEPANDASYSEDAGGEHSKKKLVAFCLAAIVLVGAAVAGVMLLPKGDSDKKEPAIAKSDLTDEQKQKLGIEPDKKEDPDVLGVEDKNNYTDEYKKYLELPDEEKDKVDAVPRKEIVPDEVVDDIKKETDDEVVSALPAKFDLRDVIDIKAENQTDGLCWAFATAKAIETNMKLHGVDYKPSVYQTDYLASNLMYGWRNIHRGGYFEDFIDIASSIGMISEEKYSSLNINSEVENDYLRLAKNDDPVYVTKTVTFPSLRKTNGKADNGWTDSEVKEFRDLVKAHIKENGGVYMAMRGPNMAPAIGIDGGTRYYYASSEEYDKLSGAHAMVIIGWDDNFPRENFLNWKISDSEDESVRVPQHDGAYLVLNSWGDDWGDEGGAFWLSYDQYDVESELAGIISTSLEDSIKINGIKSSAARDLIKDKLSFYTIEQNGEEYITDYALNRVTYLTLESKGLSNDDFGELATLFSNVSSLELSDNNISDLSPISKMSSLRSIRMNNNSIADISPICNRDVVPNFDLVNNRLTDISCLEGKKTNEYFGINISGNKGVTGFEKLTNLNTLIVDGIGLSDFRSLANLVNVSYISANDNDIRDLAGLENLNNLSYLNLSGNKQLVSLSLAKHLDQLSIDGAGLTDISILNDVDAMVVYAENNDFRDMSKYDNDAIRYLYLSGNKNMTNLTSFGSVEGLIMNNCGLKSLSGFDNVDNIRSVSFTDNEISSLDGIDKFSSVASADFSNNKLESLAGIEGLKNIDALMLENNQITSVDELEGLNSLVSIYADNNNIASVDKISGLKLSAASFSNNKITSIPSKFGDENGAYIAFANNPLNKTITIPSNALSLNLANCDVEEIDYSLARKLLSIDVRGNPKWDKYEDLAKERSKANLWISTDREFTDEEIEKIGLALSDYKNVKIALDTYTIKSVKDSDGSVNLEKYPDVRALFMHRKALSMYGATIDRAVTRLVPNNKDADSLVIEEYFHPAKMNHVSADKIIFAF